MEKNRDFCNKLIKENLVKPYDIIKHSFCKSRMKDKKLRIENKGSIICTIPTRADTLGVVVYDK